MGRLLALIVVGIMATAQFSLADVNLDRNTGRQSVSGAKSEAGEVSALPPSPAGKSTVIGGAIRSVDPVRDQLTLKVFGGKSMKILFDERTLFYRDGVKTSLRKLHPVNHASVETILDGTSIFARSIHILSQAPEGECQGQVLTYDPGTRELTVSAALSHEPIKLRVPPGTPFVGVGQATSSSAGAGPSSLVKGTLIHVKFKSGNDGRGIASQIAIVAVPGSKFVFVGNVSFLNLPAGVLALVDPRDNQSYKVSFDPANLSVSKDLREGEHVTVTATFDGTHYVADTIKIR